MKFTDGEPLTTHDVVFTLNKPASSFLNTVAMVGIVPEHAYGDDYGMNPIGSGPLKFVQWNRQEQLILEANPDYYGQIPSVRKIVLIFQDEDAAFAFVKAGQVDVARTAATLADAEIPGYDLKAITTVDCRGITLPMTSPERELSPSGYPSGDSVRQAVSIAAAQQAMDIGIEIIVEGTCWDDIARRMFSEAVCLGAATGMTFTIPRAMPMTPWTGIWSRLWRPSAGSSAWVSPIWSPSPLRAWWCSSPNAILHESAISFLGYGLPPEQPSIGIILSESMKYLSAGMWWLAVCPGLLLMVMLIDRLGDNIKTILDPYAAKE